eukprot:SAG31_NODE_11392_length_1035_cov_26.961538_1_plen_33_part_01
MYVSSVVLKFFVFAYRYSHLMRFVLNSSRSNTQ